MILTSLLALPMNFKKSTVFATLSDLFFLFLLRGSIDDKIHFLFNMYDVGHDNTVSKQELTTLLNHVPKEAFTSHDVYTPPAPALHRQASSGESCV